ncbi:MAG: DUF167 domain-containing protein [Holosporales bacterium]|jgi:uncharacterized protein (TIGR00251 family)|nr:DUF167 domain-containing protein [Holosporales bacterium]
MIANENILKLNIHLVPGAKRERVMYDKETDCFKVYVNAKPVDNTANEALINILAKTFSIPKSSLTIKVGHKTRRKIVSITGINFKKIKDYIM